MIPDLNQIALAEITTEVVAAYLTKTSVQPTDMPALIAAVHESLAGLGQAQAPAPTTRSTISDGERAK